MLVDDDLLDWFYNTLMGPNPSFENLWARSKGFAGKWKGGEGARKQNSVRPTDLSLV